VAADVEALLADLCHAAEDHVLDLLGLDARALDDLFQDERAKDDRVHVLELSVAAADGGADGFDDDYFAHELAPLLASATIAPLLSFLSPEGRGQLPLTIAL